MTLLSPVVRAQTRRLLVAASSALIASACAAGATNTPSPAGVARAQADVAGTFPGAETPSVIPSDIPFVSLEGPLWVSKGGRRFLLFSDVAEANAAGAKIYQFDPTERRFTTFAYPGAVPTSTNGLAVDASGALIACERYNGRLVRVGATDQRLTVIAERWPARDGQPLNAPNDVAARPDGNVYFTDTDWGARPGPHAPTAIYRVRPDGALDRVLAMEKPNGIALSPDGSVLYFGSDAQNKIWKVSLDASGAPTGAPALLIDGNAVAGGMKVPDGICIDDDGMLFVANNDDGIRAVIAFDPWGRTVGRIPFPVNPSNCTFGGADRRTMYVTTSHAIYAVRMARPGLP